MWAEHIPSLADEFTVYTVDMLGQPGASMQTKPMSAANECARCMDELLDGLSGMVCTLSGTYMGLDRRADRGPHARSAGIGDAHRAGQHRGSMEVLAQRSVVAVVSRC
jgi:hypothetical protein